MVSYFLGLRSTFRADDHAETTYVHEYSRPKMHAWSQNRSAHEAVCEDRENLARATDGATPVSLLRASSLTTPPPLLVASTKTAHRHPPFQLFSSTVYVIK